MVALNPTDSASVLLIVGPDEAERIVATAHRAFRAMLGMAPLPAFAD